MKEKITSLTLDMISAANTLSVPMDVRRIANHFHCSIYFYSLAQPLIETFHLQDMVSRHPGVSVGFGKTYYIFLSDELNVEEERFTIAHELGHIALGHVNPYAEQKPRTSEGTAEEEEQADLFALLLLAPAPLLDALEPKTATDIHHHTGLSMVDSRRAYLNLEEHRRSQQEAAIRADITRRAAIATVGRFKYHPEPHLVGAPAPPVLHYTDERFGSPHPVPPIHPIAYE